MFKKFSNSQLVHTLEITTKFIALLIGIGLLIASAMTIFSAFKSLYFLGASQSVQDGLFALILLEMIYVTISFIKYSRINIGLIISVGIIAGVKEMIFQFENLDLKLAIAFGVLFFSMGFLYFIENLHYKTKRQPTETVS